LNPFFVDENNVEPTSIDITVEDTDSEMKHHIFISTITEDEVCLAIKHMKQGPDYMTPDFFLYSINNITPIVIRLFASGEFQ
jgi:hypothetical protein